MEDYSLIDKFNMLMNIIVSNPLFLFCSMIGVFVLIFYIINIKQENKVNKWIFISIWIVLALILIIKYNKVMIGLLDNLFDSIFTALYFPDLATYIIVLIISNFSFVYSIFSKKISKKVRALNFVSALIINIFLILIIDIVNTNNINVYEELTVYSNSSLLILIQLTTAIFTSWILLVLLLNAYSKLKKYDKEKKEFPKMPEIVFEDI